VVPSYWEAYCCECWLLAGGRNAARDVPARVVVDVREFMSHLPAVLHQQGFEVVPVTLEVCLQGLGFSRRSSHPPVEG